MRRLTFVLLATAMAVTIFAGISFAGVKRVFVAEVGISASASAKLTPEEITLVTKSLRNAAVNNLPQNEYKIMTSETVIAQGNAILEKCESEECVITLGSAIGADFIVRGTVSKIQTMFALTVEMHETEDGNLVASSDLVRAENIVELIDKGAKACADMYRKFVNDKGSAPPTQPSVSAPTYQTPAPTLIPTPTPTPIQIQPSTIDGSGMLTDGRDGKTYKTVVIGGKRWMAKNLNYQPQTGQSWCYGNDNSKCNEYGRLYDWNMAKTVCMSGWHLPSRQEWSNLVNAAGGDKKAGKKLKAKIGWNKKGNGTDNYGFSALPGGFRFSNGGFDNASNSGNWWTATESDDLNAYRRYMGYDYGYVYENYGSKSDGRSVRCIQD